MNNQYRSVGCPKPTGVKWEIPKRNRDMTDEKTKRAWYFGTPTWFDHVEEDSSTDYQDVWWDQASKSWKPRGTIRVTLEERKQAYHSRSFAQWASHHLAETAPQRGWEACRRAVMRLVAAWGEYGVYTEIEDRILDAWYYGKPISDRELAEEAKSFGYSDIAAVLEPIWAEDDREQFGGIESMHKRLHW